MKMIKDTHQKLLEWPSNAMLFTMQKKARGVKPAHQDDVLSLDVLPPRYVASGCADGTIMIRSLETTHPLFKVSRKVLVEFCRAIYENETSP
jgi:WD40 repeat protein